MKLLKVRIMALITFPNRVKTIEDNANVRSSYATRRLNVFGVEARHAIEEHCVEPIQVNAVTDHICRQNGIRRLIMLRGSFQVSKIPSHFVSRNATRHL